MRVAYTASWKPASIQNVKASLDILKKSTLVYPLRADQSTAKRILIS